jgi:hypothetical protein
MKSVTNGFMLYGLGWKLVQNMKLEVKAVRIWLRTKKVKFA